MHLKPRIAKPRKNKYVITDEFSHALRLMEDASDHLFITGKAGTGKSTLLEIFREQTKRIVVVLAPTGIAALRVRGSTIHSFFRFPPRIITDDKIIYTPDAVKLYNDLEILVIDEVSMVRADLLDGIDKSLKLHRNNPLPFGGVKMIFIGDMHQLPPVVQESERNYFTDCYESEFFFSAKAISQVDLKTVELTHIFRQRDQYFIDLLNGIRDNRFSKEEINCLNGRYRAIASPNTSESEVWLCSTRNRANSINEEALGTIQSTEYSFKAQIDGRFDKQQLPTEEILRLKEGAQIMMVKNDTDRRWVNGTIGTIQSLGKNKIKIKIKDKIYTIQRDIWESIEYKYDRETKRIEENVIGCFIQYPIKLAWAITIHKSQSKTFEKIIIDLGRGAFAHGQVYVALSRSTSLEGVTLNSIVRECDIICDPRIIKFENEYIKPKRPF